jgi:hypothetical protein
LPHSGGAAIGGSPAYLEALVIEEIKKWRKVIRTANIKPR